MKSKDNPNRLEPWFRMRLASICSGSEQCGGCLECLLTQARQACEKAERERDKLRETLSAVCDKATRAKEAHYNENTNDADFCVDLLEDAAREAMGLLEVLTVHADLKESTVRDIIVDEILDALAICSGALSLCNGDTESNQERQSAQSLALSVLQKYGHEDSVPTCTHDSVRADQGSLVCNVCGETVAP